MGKARRRRREDSEKGLEGVPKYVRMGEAARLCGVKKGTFRKWVLAGIVPAMIQPQTRQYLFDVEELHHVMPVPYHPERDGKLVHVSRLVGMRRREFDADTAVGRGVTGSAEVGESDGLERGAFGEGGGDGDDEAGGGAEPLSAGDAAGGDGGGE